jgi:hypothetical protein
MFARRLELHLESRGRIGRGFLYEPAGFDTLTGWMPDFVAFEIHKGSAITLSGVPHLSYTVIEYKPSRPTQTYIQEFTDRCKRLFEQWEASGWLDIAYRTTFALHYGSVFNKERSTIFVDHDHGWVPFNTNRDWLAPYEKQVSATRFDLESGVLNGR